MLDLSPILSGARFRIRDCWPTGLRYLTMHFTGWNDGVRRLRCGAFGGTARARAWRRRDGMWTWSVRLAAGHATKEGAFAPSLDVSGEWVDTRAEAEAQADAAILAWMRDRIADGSVIYPWPPPPPSIGSLFGGSDA